jgi:hypothetical protein
VEERYGLQRTAPADRTADPRPSRAETEHAARTGRAEPPRITLQRTVKQAAAGSATQEEFFARLEDAGILIRHRFSVRNPGEITGYAVALPGHTDRSGKPRWFRGGELAPDLTMPKLTVRWTGPPGAPGPGNRSVNGRSTMRPPRPRLDHADRTAIYSTAARATAKAAQQFRWTADPRVRADIAAATADTLHMAAYLTGNRELGKAALSYDRAAREPYGRISPPSPYGHALRTVARTLAVIAGPTAHRVYDSVHTLLTLVNSLLDLVEAIADYRNTQGRAAQAAAASAAAGHLRAAENPGSAVPASLDSGLIAAPSPWELAMADFPVPLGFAVPPARAEASPRPSSGSTPSRSLGPRHR